MNKRIETLSATDPNTLKLQLEQMVNMGWKILGVIGHNPHCAQSEPFVILERDSADDPMINESLYANEKLLNEDFITKPEPPQKEISISMG